MRYGQTSVAGRGISMLWLNVSIRLTLTSTSNTHAGTQRIVGFVRGSRNGEENL